MISFEEAAGLLLSRDRFGILIHAYPDGDAVGSGYALMRALKEMGKRARVICSQPIPQVYSYITDIDMPDFEPECYLSVDVADLKLLGDGCEKYDGKVLLSVDHHGTNRIFAEHNIVDASASSASEMVLQLIDVLGVDIDRSIAECIYTGLSTDTGCFKYSNTTAKTHRVAARLLECGIRMGFINRLMFDTKSRARVEIERMLLDNMEFYCSGRIAVTAVTKEMVKKANATEGDLEGITSIPRQVEGVLLGVTLREKSDGSYKVSMRSYEPVNAAEICSKFGGGGHDCAAGCNLPGGIQSAKEQLLGVCVPYVEGIKDLNR